MRTHDPEAADLFLVPLFSALGSSNTKGAAGHVKLVLRALRAAHPYWDRRGGCDHVIFLTGDLGGCGVGTIGAQSIIVSHFGLLGPPSRMGALGTFRAKLEDEPTVLDEIAAGQWCHAPHKDVVAPPFVEDVPASERVKLGRSWEVGLLHSGGVWGWKNRGDRRLGAYSQGVRQALYLQSTRQNPTAGRRSDASSDAVRIVNGTLPAAAFARAKLCLAPSGFGWGVRLSNWVLLGCVPLIAQPYLLQPHEAILPLQEASVRLHDFGQLADVPELVAAIKPPRVRAMRMAMARMRTAFLWGEVGGTQAPTEVATASATAKTPAAAGLAYNLTLLALCRRAAELRGGSLASGGNCAPLEAALSEVLGPLVPSSALPSWFPPALARVTRRLAQQRTVQCRPHAAATG